jgi:hypothetical protein
LATGRYGDRSACGQHRPRAPVMMPPSRRSGRLVDRLPARDANTVALTIDGRTARGRRRQGATRPSQGHRDPVGILRLCKVGGFTLCDGAVAYADCSEVWTGASQTDRRTHHDGGPFGARPEALVEPLVDRILESQPPWCLGSHPWQARPWSSPTIRRPPTPKGQVTTAGRVPCRTAEASTREASGAVSTSSSPAGTADTSALNGALGLTGLCTGMGHNVGQLAIQNALPPDRSAEGTGVMLTLLHRARAAPAGRAGSRPRDLSRGVRVPRHAP